MNSPILTKEKIRPCPFCGAIDAPRLMSHAEINRDEDANDDEGRCPSYAVCCSFHDDGCGATGGFHVDEGRSVAFWNKRTRV